MEPSKDKWQGGYKRHRSPHFPTKSRNPDFRANQFFKSSRTPRYSKSRNGFLCRRNYPTKKINEPKKISLEDAEEEERRRKLSDTANKLLNKIKTWSVENNDGVEKNECETVDTEKSCGDTESKHKRIAHSKKTKQVKKKVTVKTKSLKSQSKASEYDVNKATVKDFQNRIQHKLINEIMQMPKENLQNVLNDPKINPIMEVKMSRLVKENKPLIAQKLRALAEAKMTSNESPSNPQLLVDIDKLIDPVIETDLSVLPFELIKQMENIFQVQFDYSGEVQASEEKHCVQTSECENGLEIDNYGNTEEGNEDFRMYECSTDEDEEEPTNAKANDTASEGVENEIILPVVEESQNVDSFLHRQIGEQVVCEQPAQEINTEESSTRQIKRTDKSWKKVKQNTCNEKIKSKTLEHHHTQQTNDDEAMVESSNSSEPAQAQQSIPNMTVHSVENTPLCKSVSTQTSSIQLPLLYGVPLPKETPESRPELLLEEVNAIHKLISKLNERRFRIFLDLLKNSSSACLNDEFTCDNFIETFSGGNVYLAESLVEFFRNKQLVGSGRCLEDGERSQHWRPLKKKRKREIPKK